ncbi:MAG: hypothetical protein IKZ47_00985 [Clostridia bacterium]|nr:hypothetical protein [Clostridia bacterium]
MINTLALINEAVKNDPAGFINACEIEYTENIKALAKRISDNREIKIVAIAGPSGSGKTTTAHILMRYLEEYGEKTAVLSLDDFYLPISKMPLLGSGERDMESVRALDIPRIGRAFKDIIASGAATVPRFDFLSKSPVENARRIEVGESGIIIVEGLHAMNPEITGLVPKANILKVYISVNLPVENESGEQILSSRQVRLARRILRDERFRGSAAQQTLCLWNNVVSGEEKHLYCFKNTADVKLTTLHSFEPCVYKEPFCAMRNSIDINTPCYEYFIKTANALERFCSIKSDLVPDNSLIREFIGNKQQ